MEDLPSKNFRSNITTFPKNKQLAELLRWFNLCIFQLIWLWWDRVDIGPFVKWAEWIIFRNFCSGMPLLLTSSWETWMRLRSRTSWVSCSRWTTTRTYNSSRRTSQGISSMWWCMEKLWLQEMKKFCSNYFPENCLGSPRRLIPFHWKAVPTIFTFYTFSSLVAKIREMFPEADGNYMGFKRKGAEEKMSWKCSYTWNSAICMKYTRVDSLSRSDDRIDGFPQ